MNEERTCPVAQWSESLAIGRSGGAASGVTVTSGVRFTTPAIRAHAPSCRVTPIFPLFRPLSTRLGSASDGRNRTIPRRTSVLIRAIETADSKAALRSASGRCPRANSPVTPPPGFAGTWTGRDQATEPFQPDAAPQAGKPTQGLSAHLATAHRPVESAQYPLPIGLDCTISATERTASGTTGRASLLAKSLAAAGWEDYPISFFPPLDTCFQITGIPDAGSPADLDGDGDMDIDDFTILADCMAGPDVTTPPSGCDPVDFANAGFDADDDVDLADFVTFQKAFGQ